MIDLHAHYLSPRALRAAARRTTAVQLAGDGTVLLFPSGPARPVQASLTDLAARAAWNASRDIRRQVVSPWLDVTGDDLPPEDARDWCRVLNDATAEDLRDEAGFQAFAAVPVSDGAAAATELTRAVEQLGFVGAALPTVVQGANLHRAQLDPLFETAEGLGAVLFLHPSRTLGADRLGEHFLTNVCGYPFETTVAALGLALDGTFARWPGLRVLLAHCGGTLPFLAGRAAHASQNAPGFDGPVDTATILGHFFYDTVLHDAAALGFALARLAGRVVLGTDAPFPMAIEAPVRSLQEAGASAAALKEVTETTPGRLLDPRTPLAPLRVRPPDGAASA